jgi:hypothetical protein
MRGEGQGRRERKYPLSRGELVQFRSWQITHGKAFARAHPPRVVSNIYFTAPDWASYSDNSAGISERVKCRLRWYGELETASEATFEAKQRRNAVGHKRQQRVPLQALALQAVPISRLHLRLRPLLAPGLRVLLDDGQRPVLYNRFTREYYETTAGLRMTVDTGMEYAALPGGSLRALHPIASAMPAVVEVKYSPEQRTEAMEALRHLPFRATRFSKYVVGVDHLFPH